MWAVARKKPKCQRPDDFSVKLCIDFAVENKMYFLNRVVDRWLWDVKKKKKASRMTTTSCKMVFNLGFFIFSCVVWSEMTPPPPAHPPLFCLVIWYVTMEATVGFYTTAGPNGTNSNDASLSRGLWSDLVMVIKREWKPSDNMKKETLFYPGPRSSRTEGCQSTWHAAVYPAPCLN